MSDHPHEQTPEPPEPAAVDSPPLESSPPLTAEHVCFAGRLASMTHADAGEIVVQAGGRAMPSVTRETTMLVVGESGLPLESDGHVSRKLQRAWQLQDAGQPLRILRETGWLQLTGLADTCNPRRTCTPAVLSQLLDVPVAAIRHWERLRLIRPVKKVGRLPWFSFQEVTAARRLIELREQGVSPGVIQAGLRQLARLFPEVDRPLVQLELLASEGHLLVRDEAGLVNPATRQRNFDFAALEEPVEEPDGTGGEDVLPFAPPAGSTPPEPRPQTAEDWFHAGCLQSDENRLTEAVESLRMCLMDRPDHAEAHFRLGDVLHRLNRPYAALERYSMAVAADHDFLEAWTLLGTVHAELGEPEAALDAFTIALMIEPNCPDTLFHQAQVLAAAGRQGEAAASFRRFLEQESAGPWADTSRDWLARETGQNHDTTGDELGDSEEQPDGSTSRGE